ncbi:glutathione ABC transporter substrate-binding protein GsiB [Actinoallomurus oryzae]|uniref:Glutathione ABC transporter substrate-binding protein GsiB n=1 Tax=Actinoallomurus oryzae TaxID=502180 RepID=A0ABP8QKQ8_9ACTN
MRPDTGWTGAARPLCAVLAGLVLAGCGGATGGTGNGAVDRNADLRIGMPVPQSLDPRQAPEPSQLLIGTWPVYDRLIQVGPQARYEPMLATKWAFSAGGRTLTLTLRHGVTFSDGTRFDAAAVKANLDASMAAAKTVVQQNLADVARVDVSGNDVVNLRLKAPSTTVLSALSSTLGGVMISPKALTAKDLATHPVGTGAYVIDSFRPGQRVVYERRTDKGGIWDTRTGGPATIEITTYPSRDAANNAVKSGQADIVTWPGDKKPIQSLLDSGRLQARALDTALNMVGLNLNRTVKPYDDIKVRQAINYAIDRNAIVKAFMPSSAPRVQPWPVGLPGFDRAREADYPYDPAKAKTLLAEAGFPNGFDGGEFLVAQAEAIPQAAEAVQADLARVGIRIKLRTVDVLSLVTQWARSKDPGELMYMSMPSIDAYSWLRRLFVNPTWVPAGPDPQMARLIRGTDDPGLTDAQRSARIGAAVDHATADALYAPLWQGVGGYLADAKVKGLDALASVNGGIADFRNVGMTR